MTETNPTTLTVQGDRILHVPSVHLLVTHPDGAKTTHGLSLAPMHIGSGPGCDIVIHDSRVSRRHCRIQLTQEGIVVRDLGSKNGTYVGNLRAIEAMLFDGAEISLGSARITVSLLGPPLKIALWQQMRFGRAVGASLVMRAAFAHLDQASRLANPLLLFGESGVGKSTLAREVHAAGGLRGKYVLLECMDTNSSAQSQSDETPAFDVAHMETAFMEAVGGSIEICEPGSLSEENQRKLLDLMIEALHGTNRFSIHGAGSVRVITTSDSDLPSSKKLLPDLEAWLSSVPVRIPPLREHADDIPLLVDHFVAACFPGAIRDALPPGTMTMLRSCPWTGNVRELQRVVKAIATLAFDSQSIIAAASRDALENVKLGRLGRLSYKEAKEEVEHVFKRVYVSEKLRASGYNVQKAADSSGVHRVHFHRLMKECSIQRKDLEEDDGAP